MYLYYACSRYSEKDTLRPLVDKRNQLFSYSGWGLAATMIDRYLMQRRYVHMTAVAVGQSGCLEA